MNPESNLNSKSESISKLGISFGLCFNVFLNIFFHLDDFVSRDAVEMRGLLDSFVAAEVQDLDESRVHFESFEERVSLRMEVFRVSKSLGSMLRSNTGAGGAGGWRWTLLARR